MINLARCFNAASANKAKYVGVAIQVDDAKSPEVIINEACNFATKLQYYKDAYDDDLTLIHCNTISIVGFTYGNTFQEIEAHLFGKSEQATKSSPCDLTLKVGVDADGLDEAKQKLEALNMQLDLITQKIGTLKIPQIN